MHRPTATKGRFLMTDPTTHPHPNRGGMGVRYPGIYTVIAVIVLGPLALPPPLWSRGLAGFVSAVAFPWSTRPHRFGSSGTYTPWDLPTMGV